jgi:hypothetical protein
MSYDMNGLQLTSVSESKNSYRLTAVDLKQKKIAAYAASKPPHQNVWSMHNIGLYKDPRDAAFVAQEFEKKYDKITVRQMIVDGTFYDIAREFRQNIDIPEWKYPAEGMTIEEMLGSKYKMNYVNNARDALLEAMKVENIKSPIVSKAKEMMAKVENLAKTGITFREAAKQVIAKEYSIHI